MARVVGVIQVAILVAYNRRHAIVSVSRTRNEYLSCLSIAQFIHIHATARSVGQIALGAVQREVHVRFAIARRNKRRALRFEAKLFAISLRNLLHAHIGKIDDRKQALSLPIVRGRAVDKRIVTAENRGRGRVCGKLHLRDLGNGTVRTDGKLMQGAIIARNGIHKPIVLNKRRTNIAALKLDRANELRQIGGIHTHLTKIATNNIVAVDHQATGPVVTTIVNGGAAGNCTRMDIDTLNGAVLYVVARPIIKSVDIDVVAVNGQRRQILHSEGIRIPQCLECFRRNSLQIAARKRNQDNTLRDNGAARAIHRGAKLKGAHNGARLGINLVEDRVPCLSAPHRSSGDEVHLSVRNNGIRRRDACARPLLLFGQKVERP